MALEVKYWNWNEWPIEVTTHTRGLGAQAFKVFNRNSRSLGTGSDVHHHNEDQLSRGSLEDAGQDEPHPHQLLLSVKR